MSDDQPSSPSSNSLCPGCQGEGSLLLPCGHTLCQACLQLCRDELGQDGSGCTECYGRELLDSVLKGLLDSLFQGQPRRVGNGMEGGETLEDGDLCSQHRERLTQYCMEDEELICDQCQGEEHEAHEFSSIEEATEECKRELRAALTPLQEKLEMLNTAKKTCQETSQHIRRQAQNTVRLIKENFENLHQFLHDEEISMLRALSEEEEKKSQKMKEKMDKLTDEIMTLREAISSTEEAMSADDMAFLKNYKKTSERMDFTVQDPEEISGALIDVAKHIGSLKFRVWEKMQTAITYTPVILDPNTADVCVAVSDDLTSIRYMEEDQQVPDNPERFSFYECVLGSEGLGSGRHSWDVEVGDCSEWALGVVKESVQRKEWFPPSPERGMWTICLYGGEYRARTASSAPLTLKKKPQKIRVQLDWEAGRVMFSDAGDNSLLYKYKHKFTEKMFPYFSNTCKRHPLHILAEKVSVYTE
ncbi:E3 ubiquitin-protein ligase TRIM39 isoform X1 [Carassius carassius]|uniref:E3 ubiquitin-protein ligase TRIM39 isoform X1 n=1 Tax=Carassius carassius TaxID=217509 RepID=UPI0028697E2F|nr:E3 ubiquitin-protein ligase TRIM39 isoform X1 [Carassius carassius]